MKIDSSCVGTQAGAGSPATKRRSHLWKVITVHDIKARWSQSAKQFYQPLNACNRITPSRDLARIHSLPRNSRAVGLDPEVNGAVIAD
jgi:hypothetical protein